MNNQSERSFWTRPRPRLLLLSGAILMVAVAVFLLVWAFDWFGVDDNTLYATFQVPAPGPLTISITESGTIRSKEQVVIKSEVEGQTTILYLIPEGTQVKDGELLVELDASKLQDNLVEQQIRMQNSDAAFVRARENLEVVKNQAKADVSKAELEARFTIEDLKMYTDGEYPKKLKELEAKIALAAEEVQRARQTFEGSQVLFREKYISQNELQGDELAAKKAELNLQLAREELGLLSQYTHQRRLDELDAARDQAAMAFERARRKASADVVQAEADLRAKEAELNQQRDKLAKIEVQIAKTRIRAPRPGLVVYSTSTQVSWRGNQDPLAEGQQVRERQDLIHLPTTDAMMVEVKVPEAKLQLVRAGLPVIVRVEALPDRTFRGYVSRIAPLPNATSVFMNPDLKVYDTEVLLEGDAAGLRTGMSCSAEIIAAHYDQALYVPVHAVLRHGRQPVVHVWKDLAFVPQPVTVGLDNSRVIHIVDGLAAGAMVLLNPPLSSAGTAQTSSSYDLTTGEAEAATPVESMARGSTLAPTERSAVAASEGVPEEVAEEPRRGNRSLQDLSPEERARLREKSGRSGRRPPPAGEGGQP